MRLLYHKYKHGGGEKNMTQDILEQERQDEVRLEKVREQRKKLQAREEVGKTET